MTLHERVREYARRLVAEVAQKYQEKETAPYSEEAVYPTIHVVAEPLSIVGQVPRNGKPA